MGAEHRRVVSSCPVSLDTPGAIAVDGCLQSAMFSVWDFLFFAFYVQGFIAKKFVVHVFYAAQRRPIDCPYQQH